MARQTLLPDAGRRVRHRTAALDGLSAHFFQNAARTVFHLAATPLARRTRRLGWFSDDLQPVLLPEKPALVYPARMAARRMDVKPPPHPRKKLERIVHFVVPHRPQHTRRQPATSARQPRLVAAPTRPAWRGATGRTAARCGGVYQLVRRYGVRTFRHFPVDGLLRHELRLACQTRRTRRLFQPVLHA